MLDTSPVCEKIKTLLDQKQIPYQLFEHEPVFTSEQAAAVRGTNQKQGAKAIIFMADRQPVLVVVPGNRRVDSKVFKKLYQIRNLRLLTADEVKELTGLEIGSIPPFGSVMNLKTYTDQAVFENDEIAFNAGAHTKSVQMKSQNFLKLEKPILGNFSLVKDS